MKKFFLTLFSIFILLIIAYITTLEVEDSYIYATVDKVVDGDTIILSNGDIVRYIGIDSPEKDSSYTKYECYSNQSTEKNKELVENKKVRLVTDKELKDRYDRLLYYVYLTDGTFINEVLVKEGYAESKAYPPNISKQNILDSAEYIAKENKIGMWNCENNN